MTRKNTLDRERDGKDAQSFGEIFSEARKEGLFTNMIGVALSSYMNGINDACRAFKASAQQPA